MAGKPSTGAPGRTREQRLRALQEANAIRLARAQLKKELASGNARIEDILAQPPRAARTAKVYDLLLALPKVGPAKAARTLTLCRVAPAKTVGGLSERQRQELIALFHP